MADWFAAPTAIQNSNFPDNGKGHMPLDPWNDHNAHLKDFPDNALFDVARNEAAQRPYRRHAVEILVNRKSPRVQHPDLRELVQELEIELDGIQFEYPAPQGPGPLIASVTTDTMHAEPTVEFHTDQVPAELPEHSGSVLVVDPPSALVVESKKPKKQKEKNVGDKQSLPDIQHA